MNTHSTNTITRFTTNAAGSRISKIFAVACLALAPAIVLAHGGLEHVMGTVAKVSDKSLTVTTTAGKSVVVNCDAKTTFSRASKPIQMTDVHTGDRVVIHAEELEEGKTYLGKTVEIGSAPAAKAVPKAPPAAH